MAERKFKHGGKEKYSLAEKDRLGKLKDENERKKTQKHTSKLPREVTFVALVVPIMKKAVKLDKK